MNAQAKAYKRFFIKTLGCKVNQYESQAMRETLVRAGFKECLSEDIADIFIINTCTVTQQADKESRHMAALFHKTNPKANIVVTGCYAENNVEQISFLPGVSNIIGNADKHRIADILSSGASILSVGPGGKPKDSTKIYDFKDHAKAFVKIQDGCENYCSYCKVPMVRGPLRSKPVMDIIEEVSGLVARGFKEIVLTGICLGAWGQDLKAKEGNGLVEVLKEFDQVRGDFRIRLSSIEPKYVTDKFIDYISGNKMICPHLHIPLQSGDDGILSRMNRPYTSEEFISIIDKVRAKIKDVAITTDVLVGFPGETDDNFKNTLKTVKKFAPSRTHIFPFSKRKGTAAYDMKGDVPHAILKRRYHELNAAALSLSFLYRSRFHGKTLNVLAETKRDKLTGMLKGYTDNYIKVHFNGKDADMMHIIPVKIDYLNLMYTLGSNE